MNRAECESTCQCVPTPAPTTSSPTTSDPTTASPTSSSPTTSPSASLQTAVSRNTTIEVIETSTSTAIHSSMVSNDGEAGENKDTFTTASIGIIHEATEYSSTSNTIVIIVIGSIGGCLCIIALLIVSILCWRTKKDSYSDEVTTPDGHKLIRIGTATKSNIIEISKQDPESPDSIISSEEPGIFKNDDTEIELEIERAEIETPGNNLDVGDDEDENIDMVYVDEPIEGNHGIGEGGMEIVYGISDETQKGDD